MCRAFWNTFPQSGGFGAFGGPEHLVVETSPANLGVTVQGTRERHDKGPLSCCRLLASPEAAKELRPREKTAVRKAALGPSEFLPRSDGRGVGGRVNMEGVGRARGNPLT